MDDAETVAEWGERWLRDWCNESGLKQHEIELRAWRAEVWRTWTLETVMSRKGWFLEARERLEENNRRWQREKEVTLFNGTLHALPVWRLFLYFRQEGQPVPEDVLAKFEQWAGRLMRLQHAAMADELTGDEGTAILRALQFTGDRKMHLSLKRLGLLERRRRVASEMAVLRRLYRMPLRELAKRFKLTEQAAKDLLYEFEPGPRRRRRSASGLTGAEALATAHRRMVQK